jgi:Kef-type K+ transport system membrane component KefB
VVLGPSVLGWVHPDATVSALALLGLSFLLFLAGSEVDLRRFRGSLGRRVAVSLLVSMPAGGLVAAGLVSVLLFPAVALALLTRAPQPAEPVGGP